MYDMPHTLLPFAILTARRSPRSWYQSNAAHKMYKAPHPDTRFAAKPEQRADIPAVFQKHLYYFRVEMQYLPDALVQLT